MQIEGSKGSYNLVQRKDRRNSGIHHTPFDLTEHMCESSIAKSGFAKSENLEFLAVDIAHGAGAFTLQMARKISQIRNIEIHSVLDQSHTRFRYRQRGIRSRIFLLSH